MNGSIKEAFLNRVLRIFSISCNSISDAEHLSGVTVVKLIERYSSAVLGDRKKVLVTHKPGHRRMNPLCCLLEAVEFVAMLPCDAPQLVFR